MSIKKCLTKLLLAAFLIAAPQVFAAASQFLAVESVLIKPEQSVEILPHAINLTSFAKPQGMESIKDLDKLNSNLLYLTKVEVNNRLYYRLVMGNFSDLKSAQQQLYRVKEVYPDAWINSRSRQEREILSGWLAQKQTQYKTTAPAVDEVSFGEKLLEQARQEFLNSHYDRVIAIAEKLIETGSVEQKQQAMELAGIARERQKKFAQAIALYSEFLKLYPDSELAPKINNRLTGLKTMRMEPKQRMARDKNRRVESDWTANGALSQYYRDDVVDQQNADSEQVNSALSTDVNLFAQRKREGDTLVVRIDAGLVNDFLADESDAHLSRAMLSYIDNDAGYQLIGGRQSRTAKGVFGRFDGLVYKGLSQPEFSYSIFAGYPVQSSHDGVETDRRFIGTSVNFKPYKDVDMDVYLLQQDVSGLIDRQALGTELQYRSDRGFLYGILDYDLFYSDINNVTLISNYRYDEKLVFNLTYDYRNAPLFSTTNALQGQTVTTIEALTALFTDKEIYQLAEDRTSKSQNLFIGSSYQIDKDHQLYLSLSLAAIQATPESGSVSAIEASDNIYLAGDYSIRGYFIPDDYTTFGVRLSDSASTQIISLRARSRLAGSTKLKYAPRIGLDYRHSKSSDVNQWILKPSFKMTYKSNNRLSFETSVGIDYSNFDLPELDDQIAYSLYLGYVYHF